MATDSNRSVGDPPTFSAQEGDPPTFPAEVGDPPSFSAKECGRPAHIFSKEGRVALPPFTTHRDEAFFEKCFERTVDAQRDADEEIRPFTT